jgi:hypothetical protein
LCARVSRSSKAECLATIATSVLTRSLPTVAMHFAAAFSLLKLATSAFSAGIQLMTGGSVALV